LRLNLMESNGQGGARQVHLGRGLGDTGAGQRSGASK